MADIVKSVEYVELVYTTDTTLSHDLTKGQDYTNCVPFFSSHGGSSTSIGSKTWDCYFSGTTLAGTINFSKSVADAGTNYMRCFVVEFDPAEVYVEHGVFDCNLSADTPTVSGTDVDRMAMVYYWKTNNTNYWTRCLCRGYVASNNQLNFSRADYAGDLSGHWFMFEAKNDQFTVEHINFDVSVGEFYGYETTTKAYDLLKSFVFCGYSGGYNGTYGDRSLLRLALLRNGLVWQKYTDGSTPEYVSAQIVEFQDTKVHIHNSAIFETALATTSGTINFSESGRLDMPVDLDYSMIIRTTPYFNGLTNITGALTPLPGIVSSLKFNSTYEIAIESVAPTVISQFCYFVIDWKGTSVSSVPSTPLDPNISFVKSVDNFRIGVDNAWNAGALTKGQDIDNCVVFSSQRAGDANSTYQQYVMYNLYISDTNMVCANRHGSDPVGSATTTHSGIIDVSVVEFYPDQVKVYSGDIASNSLTTELEVTVSGVVASNSFLLASWYNAGGSYLWTRHTVRSRIVEDEKIGFYRSTSATSVDTIYLSWFVAQDITIDNSCFSVKHWISDVAAAYSTSVYATDYLSENDGYYPFTNTFTLTSHTGGINSAPNPGWGLAVSRFSYVTSPQIISRYNASNPVYFSGQIVTITRNGREHTYSYSVADANDTTLEFNYPTSWSGSSDITVFNNMFGSWCYSDAGNIIENSRVFWTVRVDDYDSRTVIAERGSSGDTTNIPSFCCICWPGTDVGDYATDYATPTKSLVRSVTKFTDSDNSTINNYWWLADGQTPTNCVPFATWTCSTSAAGIVSRGLRLFKVEYENGPPYKLFMQKGYADVNSDGETLVYLVEFDDSQVKIQSGVCSVPGTSIDITIDEVVLEKAFLIFYSFVNTGSVAWAYSNISGRIKDSTTLTFARSHASVNMNISWYVVECLQDQWAVQHLFNAAAIDSLSIYPTVPEHNYFDFSNIWVFSSYMGGYSGGPNANLSALTTVIDFEYISHFRRFQTSNAPSNFVNQIVEFNKDAGIKVLWKNAITGEFTQDNEIETLAPMDSTRTIVFNPGANNMAALNCTTNDGVENCFILKEATTFSGSTVTINLRKVRDNYDTYTCVCATEFPEYKGYYMEGYVDELDVPVIRNVYAYRSDTGALVDYTVSASGTGYFCLETSYSGTHYIVCLDDEEGADYNDLIYGEVYPTVISGSFAFLSGLTDSDLACGIPLCRQ